MGGTRRFAPLLAGCLLAAPAVVVGWPPSSDLASHEAMLALLARFGDPTFAPRDVYSLALGHQGQLFYALAWPLALLTGTGLACKLVVASSIAALVALAGRLAAYLGRSPWGALAVAPAALGALFYRGAAPQMLGLALWVGALPLLDRAAERPTWRRTALAASAVALLAFAHSTSLAWACLASGVFALCHAPDRLTPVRLAPAALGAALGALEMVWQARVETPLARIYSSRILWHPLGTKLASLADNLIGPHGTVIEAMLVLLLAVAAVLWRIRPPEPGVDDVADPVGRARTVRFAALSAALFVAYLAAPFSVNFGAMLYACFLAPAYVVGVVLLAPPAGTRGIVLAAPAFALVLAPLVAAIPQLAAAQREWVAVEPLIARIDAGSAVWIIQFGRHDRSLAFDPLGFGYRALAERGGRAAFSLAEYPDAPVVIRPDHRWDRTLVRAVVGGSGSLRPAHDLRRFRWVLAHVYEQTLIPDVILAFAPEGELAAAQGEWMLLRSRLPQVPITAPDEDPPEGAETLQDRVERFK